MELLIAILIALRVLITPDEFTDAYADQNQDQIRQANEIIDNNWYHRDADGGVIIDNGVGE